MKTEEIFKQIYQDLKAEISKNSSDIFLKEYTIPSINYNKNNTDIENIYFASGIEMELEQMMSKFGYKIFYSCYKEKYFFSNDNDKVQDKMQEEIEKETRAELEQKLEEKIDNEYEKLVEELKQSTPEQIIERAYELVIKEEMTYKFKCRWYEIETLQTLLNTDEILQHFYDKWLKSDGGIDEVLEDTVSDEINFLVEKCSKEKQPIKDSKESR